MENHLDNLSEFKRILVGYEVSERAKKSLQSTKLVLLLAPSGTGRNTLIHKLLSTGDYNYIVSDTTRHPRENNGTREQNGVEYWFRSEKEILSDLEKGEFLEAEIIHNQQVSGISIRELENAAKQDKISITDIDIGGVKQILKAKPDVIVILVIPPSFSEWQRRLSGRGNLHTAEYDRRMETARNIFTQSSEINQLIYVVNDSQDKAANQIREIVAGKIDTATQEAAKNLEKTILEKTLGTLAK